MKLLILICTTLILCGATFSEKSCTNGTIYQCDVKLPQDENPSSFCDIHRKNEILAQQTYWKFAKRKTPGDFNPNNELLTPKLDQTTETIATVARFGDDIRWFSLYYTLVSLLETSAKNITQSPLIKLPMTSYTEYKQFYHLFNSVVNNLAKVAPQAYSLPSNYPHYTNIVDEDLWREDKYFIQRRLAGTCPYFLKKVTNDGKVGMSGKKLEKLLNDNFDWVKQLQLVTNDAQTDYHKEIAKGNLFVLYHEEYNDLERTPDILGSGVEGVTLMDSPTPITLFVVRNKELKIIAIQANYSKNSKVVVPSTNIDDQDWLITKANVEIVEMAMCQIKGHLLDSHVTAESYCNLFRRHFSSRHPLHALFAPHCEGTTPVGALGISALVDEGRYMHQLFGIGYIGTRQLINKLYQKHTYEDSDFDVQLQKQGLDNIDIDYFPYREDGRVIWKEIKSFVRKYVELYYKSKKDVKEDSELKSFVNEMSADGDEELGPKYKSFPKEMTKPKEVETMMTRFIWLSVLHTVNSYPLNKYVPIAPTKLYNDRTSSGEFARNLPNARVAMVQSVLTFTLSSLRANRLFDYSKKLTKSSARCLLRDTFTRLNTCVQKKLEKRNKKRYENKDLTYQYMEPKWLPNSIHS